MKKLVQISICEDEAVMAHEIEEMLFCHAKEWHLECDVFHSAESLFNYVEKTGTVFDICLLDIELGDSSGMELAKTIRKSSRECIIIFISSHEEYIYEAFDLLAFNFIKKPIDRKRFDTVIQKALMELSFRKKIFTFSYKSKKIYLECEKIKYFESNRRKMLAYMSDEEVFIYYDTVKNTWKHLNEKIFIRCHTSYIVNMEYIAVMDKEKLLLKSGEIIPISKRYRQASRRSYHEFLLRRM